MATSTFKSEAEFERALIAALTENYGWSKDILLHPTEQDLLENWKRILYDGDNISVTLMTIDAKTYDYLQQLGRGQSHGANPHSNITGGCLGYFAAGSVVHTDTIVFQRNNVKEWQK